MRYNTWCFFDSFEDLPHIIELSNNVSLVLVNYGQHCQPMNYSVSGATIFGIEIEASVKQDAIETADLLCACHSVVEGYNYESSEEIIRRFDKDESDIFSQTGKKGVVYGDDRLYLACKVLKTIYNNQQYKNAVCKYYVAHEIYALHPMDLDPWKDPFISDYLLSDRVRIANVIVNCYSILEELHLQIKACQANPSVINGEWNPLVKKEMQDRLIKSKINPLKTIPWLTRNGVVRPFKNTAIKHDSLCEWSDGKEIADFEIAICDAILELSYMRSQLSSHNLGNNVLKLSVYDAENAFALSRFILLMLFEIDIFQ